MWARGGVRLGSRKGAQKGLRGRVRRDLFLDATRETQPEGSGRKKQALPSLLPDPWTHVAFQCTSLPDPPFCPPCKSCPSPSHLCTAPPLPLHPPASSTHHHPHLCAGHGEDRSPQDLVRPTYGTACRVAVTQPGQRAPGNEEAGSEQKQAGELRGRRGASTGMHDREADGG